MADINYDTVGHTVIAICLVFGVLTAFVMSIRLFARIWIIRAVGADDILMLIASLFSWAFIVATILAVQHGLGSHIEVVMLRGADNFTAYLQIVWLSSIFYNATLGFIKTSVLAFYSRLGDRKLRRASLIVAVLVGASATANVLVCIFQCSPIPAAWDTSITEKKCVNINGFYLANAGTNIATDLVTYLLPINLVINLQVPYKQKVVLCVTLCLGLFACISSIIRISFIPRMLTDPDATWAISGAMYWSVIETNIGILAASIPSFKPIAKRYLPRVIGDYSSRDRGTSNLQSGSRARSPFKRLGDHAVGLRSMSSRNKDGGVMTTISSDPSDTSEPPKKNGAVETTIEHGRRESTSSKERIFAPPGQIVTHTNITRYVEGNSDVESL
ncbi:MAG: hypothetical protein M4579_003375 [Chaenotheca gracillima]|nr:MAG: hypothetical protein M4579_003375 [Chaenotheca gracillima]